MFEVSQHFRERYAERVKGITDLPTRNSWIYANGDSIKEWGNKMIEFGELFYEGTMGDKYVGRKYFRNGEYIIIQSPTDNNLITLYEIGFGFNLDNNKEISKILTSEIRALEEEIMEDSIHCDELKENTDSQIADCDLQIDTLKKQIERLELRKTVLNSEVRTQKLSIVEKQNKMEQLFVRIIGKGFGEELKKK